MSEEEATFFHVETLGNQIYSPAMERMTAREATKRKPGSPQGPVSLDGLPCIRAAARPETAMAAQQGRQEQPIGLNDEQQQASGVSHFVRRDAGSGP